MRERERASEVSMSTLSLIRSKLHLKGTVMVLILINYCINWFGSNDVFISLINFELDLPMVTMKSKKSFSSESQLHHYDGLKSPFICVKYISKFKFPLLHLDECLIHPHTHTLYLNTH